MMFMDRFCMNTSADACSAPAGQYASMTSNSNCAIVMDTAIAAVSFFPIDLREVLRLPARIIPA